MHPSTNPEILVKIGQLASEIQVFRSRPLKKQKNKNKENTSAKYIALLVSLPSGLIYAFVMCTENENEPYRELFIWAVFFNRMPLANYFWRKCPNAIGAALVASKLCKSLAEKAHWPATQSLADELNDNARFVGKSTIYLSGRAP